jgi:hypothetical protein
MFSAVASPGAGSPLAYDGKLMHQVKCALDPKRGWTCQMAPGTAMPFQFSSVHLLGKRDFEVLVANSHLAHYYMAT